MCDSTDIACQIGVAISNVFFLPFFALSGYLISNLDSAVEFTPSLNNHVVWQVWSIAYGVFLSLLSLALIGIGILYIISPLVEKRFAYKQILYKLGAAFVLGSCSMIIGNFAIELANALAQAFLGNISAWTIYSGGFTNTAGPIWVGIFLVLVMLFLMNAIRILAVFFLGALLPWAFLLWSFPTTSKLGKKMIKMFFEWTFCNVFMAVVLYIGLSFGTGGGTTGNGLLDQFLILGAFTLAAMMPAFMGFGGGMAAGIAAGMIASQITDTASNMAAGAAGGVKAGAAAAGKAAGAAKGAGGAAGGGGGSGFGGAGKGGGFGHFGGGGGIMNPMGRAGGALGYAWGHVLGRGAHAVGSKIAPHAKRATDAIKSKVGISGKPESGAPAATASIQPQRQQGPTPLTAGDFQQYLSGYKARHGGRAPSRPLASPTGSPMFG